MAFILNYEQHWYTLRRFGSENDGIWFDLNSFLAVPGRVGSTYLGMVLQQAEAEGYSVFAVVPKDSTKPVQLPKSDADTAASSVPSSSAQAAGVHGVAGFEDEDMELQAVLQASLMASEAGSSSLASHGASSSDAAYPPPISADPSNNPLRPMGTNTGIRTPTQRHQPGYSILNANEEVEDDDDEDYVDAVEYPPTSYTATTAHTATSPEPVDPVEASRRRNEALMEQMRRQQEAAMRFTQHQEEVRVRAGLQTRRQTREEQEQEEIEKAIRASMEEARARGENAIMDEPEELPAVQTARPTQTFESYRVYDDDDAELQAALKASLESAPEGFQVPSTPPPPQPPSLPSQPEPASIPSAPVMSTSTSKTGDDDGDVETESEADSSVAGEEVKAASVNVEEMRRRRLERFGS